MDITNGIVSRSAPGAGSQLDRDIRAERALPPASDPNEGFLTVQGLLNSIALGIGLWAVLLTVLWLIFA